MSIIEQWVERVGESRGGGGGGLARHLWSPAGLNQPITPRASEFISISDGMMAIRSNRIQNRRKSMPTHK